MRRFAEGTASELYRRVVARPAGRRSCSRPPTGIPHHDVSRPGTTPSAASPSTYTEFKRLLEMADKLRHTGALAPEEEEVLRRLERDDFPFPDLDPRWALGDDRP